MAGNHNAGGAVTQRDLPRPTGSQNWHELGFAEFPTRITQGQQDKRVPVISDRLPRYPIGTYAGMQLRQPLSLLSQRYNIAFSAHTGQEYQPQMVTLSTNKVSTGLGIGTLKNLDRNAPTSFRNILSKASAYGRLSSRIPSQ